MVDVTDIPEVQPGDVATIFGTDLSVAEQAEKAGTIPYELLCAMSPARAARIYRLRYKFRSDGDNNCAPTYRPGQIFHRR